MTDGNIKKLVLFYSFEGNTRAVGETIAKATNADIAELKYIKELKSRGFIKYLWGGKQVIFKQKPKLVPLEIDVNNYDIIYIGTPVWAGNFTPPLRTLFSQKKVKNKKIALFCCYKGNEGKTLKNMSNELKDNTILGEIGIKEPLAYDIDKTMKSVESWAMEILEKAKSYE